MLNINERAKDKYYSNFQVFSHVDTWHDTQHKKTQFLIKTLPISNFKYLIFHNIIELESKFWTFNNVLHDFEQFERQLIAEKTIFFYILYSKYILIEIIILYFCVQLWLCEFQIFLPLIAVVFVAFSEFYDFVSWFYDSRFTYCHPFIFFVPHSRSHVSCPTISHLRALKWISKSEVSFPRTNRNRIKFYLFISHATRSSLLISIRDITKALSYCER